MFLRVCRLEPITGKMPKRFFMIGSTNRKEQLEGVDFDFVCVAFVSLRLCA